MCNVYADHALLGTVIVSSLFLLGSARADCWDTECQFDSWKERGCQVYGMEEVGQRPCTRGVIFTCCRNSYEEADYSELNGVKNLGYTGDLTYYELGLTACGDTYSNSDMVAALAFNHFTTPNPNDDPLCGQRLKIVDFTTGKSIFVKVVDKCEGCKPSDVDVSPTAFEILRPLSTGRFQVSWDFV